jgi:hypothetical protein
VLIDAPQLNVWPGLKYFARMFIIFDHPLLVLIGRLGLQDHLKILMPGHVPGTL